MKQKADVVIFGNLIGERQIEGGGIFCLPDNGKIDDYFETDNAIVVHGDVCVDTFDAGSRTVVVCGSVAQKGGSNEP